ncbi:hypothetical protein EDB80DRAFT_691065 [Ilyonectria destructans]|nr:hypothetical protein EDB80DRAFT_691065 [Ilyonectria destructans]
MLPHLVQSFQPSPLQQITPPSSPLLKPTNATNSVAFNESLGLDGKDVKSSFAERLLTALEKLLTERGTSDSLSSGDNAPTEAKQPQAELVSNLAYKRVEKSYDNQYPNRTLANE